MGLRLAIEETGATYEANASMKAKAYARESGLVTLADDSGLEVDALNGAPGPRSARFAGARASDAENVDLLLHKLKGIPWERRAARFVCAVAVATPSEEMLLFRGSCEGIIAFERSGTSGFGYDPVFYLPRLGMTMAQLTLKQKNRISHRAQAVRESLPAIEVLIGRPGGEKGTARLAANF